MAKKIKLQQTKIFQNLPIIILGIWYFFTWSWVFITDSLNLAGSVIVARIIAVFLITINVAISVFLVTTAFKYLKTKFSKFKTWQVVVFGIPVFALLDFLVSWLSAIIWIGPQGSIDSVLPLSSPSLILVNTPLKYASRLVGFYGLAGFFWLIIFLMTQKQLRKHIKTTCVVLLVLSTIGWLMYKTPNGRSIKATVISETLSNRVGNMANRGSELVVFPEYGLEKIDNSNLSTRLSENEDDSKTFFIGSQQVFDSRPTGHINMMLFGNNKDGIIAQQEKHRLIPGGEDLSFLVRAGLIATNRKSTIDYFSYQKMVNKGSEPLHNFKLDDQTVLGSAVCSSIISPKDYQELTKSGATILTNSASLSIFKGSRIFSWQQKSLAKFMAVANSRYFLQSANAASAYVLDNNGNQKAEVKGIEAIDYVAKTNTNKTLYTIIGDYLTALGSLIVAIWLISYLKTQKVQKKSNKKVSKAKIKKNQ